MPRWLLTPRWIGLFIVLLLVVAACAWLGRWQWEQARVEQIRTPPTGVAPLVEAHRLQAPVDVETAGREVSMSGRFDPAREVVVVDRLSDGELGSWVVTAFVTRDAGGVQAAIPVVRGWLPEGESPPQPPGGRQDVVGWLEPSESGALRESQADALSQDEVEIVSTPELLSLWQPPLYEGFVIQKDASPQAPLRPVSPPERVTVVTDWQNAAYAVQWWVFGLFAVFWFIRMVKVAAEDRASTPGRRSDDGAESMGP